MQTLFTLLVLVIGSLGLEIPSGETIGFELGIGTLTGLGSVKFEPDYCFPTVGKASQTSINHESVSTIRDTLNTATLASVPATGSTRTLTQTVIKTIIETVLTTVSPKSSPTIPSILITASLRTGTEGGIGNGTVSFSFGSPPIPTYDTTLAISGARELSIQQGWYPFTIMVACFCFLWP
ncbi:uncharacterized protein F4817DRAFT_367642 [Daldinia loculata]|uniref:uncharacterized protein n=1 Tax=Daldinia loculata TaxID=103429 RepID=UPI0020C45E1D|nr:uncharacterized protein F4817DRAFT_367642 [Daldinia loculata]KAI1644345.1 hypothetical protein F4817DRAFT_367642 [Daldinia loculata]